MRTRICQEEFVYELVLKQTSKDANNHVNRDRGFVGGRAVETKEYPRGQASSDNLSA